MPPFSPRLAAVAVACLSAEAAQAGVVQIQAQGPVIEVTALQTVDSEPDQAIVSAGVTVRERTAVTAMQSNAKRMEAVIARIKALGVAERDIQTSGLNLNPSYQYNSDNRPPTFLGYDVTNTVSVLMRDVARVGPILDALVAAGANNIGGPTFRREDDTAPREEARKLAFARAEAQARSLARIAGYPGVRLLEVNEGQADNPREIFVTSAKAVPQQAPATPIQPGRVGATVQLTVKYEMTR